MTAGERVQSGEAGDAPRSVREVFARVIERAEGPAVSVGRILDAFGGRAYGPLLFLIGVVAISPLSAIPGAMIFSALLTVALMVQSMARRGPPWIPRRIRRVEVETARMRWAMETVLPWFEKLERMMRPRLEALVRPPVVHLWAVCCILIGLTLIPLTVVPFGVVVPGLSLAVIGLGLMGADGVLVLIGVAISGGAFWLALTALSAAAQA